MDRLLRMIDALKLIGLTKRTLYDWPPDKRPPFKMRRVPGSISPKPERSIYLSELKAWCAAQERPPEARQLTRKQPGRMIWAE